MLKTPHSSLFYHYTTKEGLDGILKSGTIKPTFPHPRTPGKLGDINLSDGAVFLTRMDPRNNKKSIAFNNYRCVQTQTNFIGVGFDYSSVVFFFPKYVWKLKLYSEKTNPNWIEFPSVGWEKNSRKVEAYVAVEICFGPRLVEEAVRKKSVYRNIVAWSGGPLDLSNEKHVKSFWTGTVHEKKDEKRDESKQLVKSANLIWKISKPGVEYEEEEDIDYIHCHREKLDDVKALFSMINQRAINQLISEWNESKEEESVNSFPQHEEFSAAICEEEFESCEKNQSEDNDEDLFPEHEDFSAAIREEESQGRLALI